MLFRGTYTDALRAVAACLDHGLPLHALRRVDAEAFNQRLGETVWALEEEVRG